jgi:geranylgeranyl pyrophosphate synthase
VVGGHSVITSEELTLIENALRQAVVSNVSLLSRAGEYIILSGGKRLRPQIALLSYRAAGGEDISRVVPLAVAVELLHTASLIHDDINDGSDMRRGHTTVNARWGHALALLTGDFIFIRLLNLMASFDSRIVQGLADSCLALVEGEVRQMLSLGDTEMTEETYLEIVAQKTASLFSACTELGAILAGGAEEQVAALREYGLSFGTAYQIRDDTLDLVSTRDELGKPVTSDLKQGKMSLALLFALRESERTREMLFSGDMAQAVQLLYDIGAIDYAMQKATEYATAAKRSLSILPQSEAKAALLELADFAIARDR